jgi:hypothetical protein
MDLGAEAAFMSGSSQRFWLNSVLLIVLLVVGGGGYWVWQQTQAANEPKSLLSMQRSELQSIVIERYWEKPQAERIEFERQGEAWFMIKPYALEANPVKLTQLMTLPFEPVLAAYPKAGQDLKSFGLEPLSTRLLFNDQVLGFGNSNPITQQRYLLVKDQIILVSEVVAGLIMGSTLDLVARTLIPTNRSIKAVLLPDGSQQTGVGFLNNWRSASAVLLEPVSLINASQSQVKIILTDSREITFLVERTEQDLKLTNVAAKLTYILPISMADKLLKAN